MSEQSVDGSQYFRDLYQLTSADLSTEEKIRQAIDTGRERLGVEYGVLSYTGDGNYEVVQTNITTGKYVAGSVTDLDVTWCRHVVDRREPLAFGDVEATDYRDDVAKEATGLACYIGTPILIDGETYGTLCFSGEEPRPTDFDAQHEQFVTLLGDWISHEIERAKHHQALREQNERLDEFTGVVAHDLRNPLSGAKGFTELAIEHAADEVRAFLQRVDGSLSRMDSLVGECLMLAKQGTDVGQRQKTELAMVARDAWDTVDPQAATLTIETDRTVYADATRLQQLFENLFRNAAEHCPAGTTVTIGDRPTGFAVSDDGPGIPSSIEAALNDSDDVEDIKQLGLGLLIVQRIVSGHNWTLAVDGSDDGTTFEFTEINTAPPTHQGGLDT
ncbi:MAG: GAF domain-containing sensor histidine kinase [Halobacteriales archaeon]|nr:GAF domain-containing sensor histidine kinase [Halobacteriales archaeon]